MTLIHVQPALAPPAFPHEEHHLLASCVDDSFDLNRPVVPLVCPAPDVVHDCLMAPSNVAVRKVGSIPFNVWVIERKGGLNVPRQPCIPHPPYRLHVLLRHRLHEPRGLLRRPVRHEANALPLIVEVELLPAAVLTLLLAGR